MCCFVNACVFVLSRECTCIPVCVYLHLYVVYMVCVDGYCLGECENKLE